MGLAGRKEKQRIGVDPRNTTWADDASRFGKAYLEKFGWSNGTGLGAEGDGRTSHLKVMHKLDLMGIGANRVREGDEGGQGREYERLLKRLNESVIPTPSEDSESTPPTESVPIAEEERPKKKRKKDAQVEEPEAPKPVSLPRPMAHRSKFLRSKNMAKNSQTALNEILGISSTSNTPTPLPATPVLTDPNSGATSGAQTPASEAQTSDQTDLLSTSTKSVADYFAEKLAARKKSNLASTSASVIPPQPEPEPSTSEAPVEKDDEKDAELEKQRRKEEKRRRKKEKRAEENEQTGGDDEVAKAEAKKSKRKAKKEAEGDLPVLEAEAEDRKERKKKKKRKAGDDV